MKRMKKTVIAGLATLIVSGALLLHIVTTQGTVAASPINPIVSSAPAVETAPATISGNPIKLDIPSLGLSLSVIPGVYNPTSKTWTLTSDKVQFATITAQPNNAAGNTFIYGHYRKGVFSTLHTIPAGAVAIVKTDNGHVFYYILDSSRITNPSDDSLFHYQGKPILTIQTCAGAFYQNRQLFTFHLQRVV